MSYAAEQGNKNGCIVTDFIMILLLSSIYEDDNGIESPDIANNTKETFFILCLIWYMFRFYSWQLETCG